MKKQDQKLLYASGFAALIGSLCCLGPVILILLGIGSVSGALLIGRYSLFFTILSLVFFGAAVLFYLRRKKACNIRGFKDNSKSIIISFIILITLLIILKYGLAPLIARIAYR